MVDMTQSEIEFLLDNARIGRLCMADADGWPYAIPMPFCRAGGTIYLRVPLTGRKGQILSANNRVCFEVDFVTDTLDDYRSVLVEGTLEAVHSLEEKQRICAINEEKYQRLRHGHRPGHGRGRPLAELPLRKIHVRAMAGRKKEPAAAQE
jgi:nitroimidazol reductase NimA-like FMN-containing flavoprotein (pyridoxamine 5'-phosphate oxidase superfamily)